VITRIILYVLAGFALVILLRKLHCGAAVARQASLADGAFSHGAPLWLAGTFYEYDDSQFFRTDGAPEDVVAARRAGFMRLGQVFAERFAKTAGLTGEIAGGVSDLQFTSRYACRSNSSGYVRRPSRRAASSNPRPV